MKENNTVEESELPVTRKQAFFKIFRENYKEILLTSVFTTLFALPVVVILLFTFIQLSAMEDYMSMYSVRRWMYLLCIPAFAILAVGLSGGFHVARKLSWNQDVKFFRDFGSGIKNNWFQSVVVAVLFSVFAAALNYVTDLLILNFELGDFYIILVVIQAILLFLAMALLLFQLCEIAVYQGSIFKQIKNSFVLTFGSLPSTMLIMLAEIAPFVLIVLFMSLGITVVSIIISTAFALVGFGYCILLYTLYSHSVFDKYVNVNEYPEIYKKGLYDVEAEQKKYEKEHKRNIFD